MAKLTKAQRAFLERAKSSMRLLNVYPDERSTVQALENKGLLCGNGRHLNRTTCITPASRAALAETEQR